MKTGITRQFSKLALVVAAAGLLGGCATSGNPKDPIEGFNRAMFGFNEGLDKVIIKPVATGYEAVLPDPIQTGVANFFSNIADLMIGVNNLLQGKPAQAASDAGRVLVNTTMGFLGIIDVASSMGMEKHEEDVGQTFGRWGMDDGAYVVLPFFGSRTVRDTFGLAFDVYTDPVAHVDHIPTRNVLLTTRLISDRAEFLKADKVIEEAALDKYSYVRDAYLQRRRSLIHDGNPPKFDPYSGSGDGKSADAQGEGSTAQVAARN
ncbi:MAG: VacJ family lipoprotein [Rhodocyclaceae bacterium]|nr:VacJ family lipoprotein [Rhodocyclaceae bacterium]